jgi:hypothetical protein
VREREREREKCVTKFNVWKALDTRKIICFEWKAFQNCLEWRVCLCMTANMCVGKLLNLSGAPFFTPSKYKLKGFVYLTFFLLLLLVVVYVNVHIFFVRIHYFTFNHSYPGFVKKSDGKKACKLYVNKSENSRFSVFWKQGKSLNWHVYQSL